MIVGTGSGLSYAELGATHHSLEDLAILRSIPNLQICAPADSIELEAQLREAVTSDKPTYIRIGKKGEPNLFKDKNNMGIGKANLIKHGKDSLIIGIGPIISEGIEAIEKLSSEGINVGIASMGSIKPLDEDFLLQAISDGYTKWISLEEHYISGGLGSTLLEWLNDNDYLDTVKLKRIGICDEFIHELGRQSYIRNIKKIDSKGIYEKVIEA